MAQAIRNMHLVDETAGGSQAVEQVHIDNLPAGGGAQTTIPTGALVPGAGIDLTRDGEGVLTCAVKAKGVTAAMMADGVIPPAYTLPAATTAALGGVKRAEAIAPLAADADAAAVLAKVNEILAKGKAAGFLS